MTLLFASFALAVAPEQKAIIVSYDDNTPSHIMEQAIQAIKDAGGKITHEYKIFMYVAPAFLSHPRSLISLSFFLTLCLSRSN